MKTHRTTSLQLDRWGQILKKGKDNFTKKRNIFIFMLFVFLMIFIFMFVGCIGSWLHPLPFEGPYRGMIVDASNGKPIIGANIQATWMCWDSPYPHIAEYVVYAHSTTDEKGRYKLNRPRRRGGWFGGDFSITVYSKGYIKTKFYISPKIAPQIKVTPSEITIAVSKFQSILNIKLEPAKSILLEFLKSKNALYRSVAAEELVALGHVNSNILTVLITLLNNEGKWIQASTVRTLAKIGYNAHNAVPALQKMLTEKMLDKYLRLEIEDAIKKINSDALDNMSFKNK